MTTAGPRRSQIPVLPKAAVVGMRRRFTRGTGGNAGRAAPQPPGLLPPVLRVRARMRARIRRARRRRNALLELTTGINLGTVDHRWFWKDRAVRAQWNYAGRLARPCLAAGTLGAPSATHR